MFHSNSEVGDRKFLEMSLFCLSLLHGISNTDMNITKQVAYHWRCGFPSASEAQVVGLGLWLSAI